MELLELLEEKKKELEAQRMAKSLENAEETIAAQVAQFKADLEKEYEENKAAALNALDLKLEVINEMIEEEKEKASKAEIVEEVIEEVVGDPNNEINN